MRGAAARRGVLEPALIALALALLVGLVFERVRGHAFLLLDDAEYVTANGWVQSYGSRCVKPPIIFGDVSRPGPMTLHWTRVAQKYTTRPVKGMLTGPVTILQWSFVRNDQPRRETCRQIALAIRDEVTDLEKAGVKIIQIDEAALREGLPIRKSEWQAYLDWAVEAFRLGLGVDDRHQHRGIDHEPQRRGCPCSS